MKTPKEYTANLQKGIITRTMLSDALYSVNKRAKNYRDKEKRYRGYRYDNEEKNREQKKKMYAKKDKLLSVVSPTCIHREFTGYAKERIYDNDYRFDEHMVTDDYVWHNSYYDREEDREVEFVDVISSEPCYNYYLFYDLGTEHTYHTPIEEEQLKEYAALEIKDIDTLQTKGNEITELLSMQFVDKVVSLIESQKYTIAG